MGLGIMLFCGALNALIMNYSDWLTELERPAISPTLFSVLWLIDYLFTAAIFGELFVEKPLRKYLVLPLAAQVLNALWCLIFFRLHNAIVPLFIMALLFGLHVVMVFVCAKKTGIFVIFPSLLLFWYAFLSGVNILIVVLN